MLLKAFAAFSLSIEAHSYFFKDYYLFGGHNPEFRHHFYMGFRRILVETDTPKTDRFSQFASFWAH